jgi:hypothetical protein
MIATIHNEQEFSELFISYLWTRSSRIEEDLIDQLFNSSEKRLARLLLLLANFGKEGRPEPIVGKLAQVRHHDNDSSSGVDEMKRITLICAWPLRFSRCSVRSLMSFC